MEDINIGEKIKEYRTLKKLSIRKVASEAGITASMLSQIESGQVNPSINTLKSIAHVIEKPIYSFFLNDNEQSKVVTPQTRITVGGIDNTDIRYELLTPDTNGEIECCMMVFPPQTTSSKTAQSHKGEEVAYVVSGLEIELEMNGEFLKLKQGDSIRIPAQASHCWRNYSKYEVQVLFSVTPPNF